MSETENPGQPTAGEPGNEPTHPSEPAPLVPPAYSAPVPPAYPGSYPSGSPAFGSGYPAPGSVPVPQAPVPAPSGSAGLPRWTWPLVTALAFVVGLGGGVIGAKLVDNNSTGSVGVLQVQRRTAPPLPADNGSIAAVAAKVLPSTVQIVAEYKGKAQGATGSGFVFDRQGHVITNNHVVADAAENDGPIDVIDQAGKHHAATVVGRSPVYDIAVLEVQGAEKLTPASIGSADQMRVGETVVAFGSPLGLSATVTSGIISAVHRPVTTGDGGDSSYINALQTDAAINPGNSGGPLVNLQGQVIGVNSAIASLGSTSSSGESANIGVGFAIPIEQVQVTADQILRTGKAQYPVMGATVRGTAKGIGATVESIASGSPAASSDLKVGDLITAVDGQPVTGSIDVVVAIRAHQPGEHVVLTVVRGGRTLKISVGLSAKTG